MRNEQIRNKELLLSWIGQHDLDACQGKIGGKGPILQAVEESNKSLHINFEEVHLLYNFEDIECVNYKRWLQEKVSLPVKLHKANLKSPMDYDQIYKAALKLIENLLKYSVNLKFTLHLSPGTSAMAAIWIILGKLDIKLKTGFHARLIHSSKDHGVSVAEFPFNLLAVFQGAIDEVLKLPLPEDFVAVDPLTISAAKKLEMASIWPFVGILLTGETGTGKEEFAKLVKQVYAQTSDRQIENIPFIAINCAAIPETLIESELFGILEGIASDVKKRKGKFEEADGGILFLDEVGELTLSAQAKLLRVINDKKIIPVGGTEEIEVKVRIVAATNRDLLLEVAQGRFREDLYYRLAEVEIHLPPLRERKKDILIHARKQLRALNELGEKHIPNYKIKQFSQEAEQYLLTYHWPGNIRELYSVIKQAVIWNDGDMITGSLLLPHRKKMATQSSVHHPLLPEIESGINLKELLEKIKKDYVLQAYARTSNQDAAAMLLGYRGRGSIYKYFP